MDLATDTMSDATPSQPISETQQQWLDKLWSCLFDGNNGGLMSPGQMRRERRDREHVRQLEMAAILEAEAEMNDIHQGLKALDDYGNLIDTPPVEAVATHSIIENDSIDQSLDLMLDTPAAMIRSVVKEVSVRDLERSLNLRKIAILAESEILARSERPVSTQPVKIEWLTRWRESAQTVFNPELQLLWARMLVQEVALPGEFSLGALTTLLQFEQADIEAFRMVGHYAFPDFVYQAEGYFSDDSHGEFFEVMEELGLLSSSPSNRTIKLVQNNALERLLPCGTKALKITGNEAMAPKLPVYKLSRYGRQMMKLADKNADLAYLFHLAKAIKEQGFEVALGDCSDSFEDGYCFEEKMRL